MVEMRKQTSSACYNAHMQTAASLPTHVPTLQQLVLEQQHMIETLKEELRLMLRRQFGPRHEAVNLDQMGLFAKPDDTSTVIEVTEQVSEPCRRETVQTLHTERKQAIRLLKTLPREIRVVDIPDAEKVCGCCGGALHRFGEESSEQLHYLPAVLKIIETRRQKYACGHCHGEVKRAKDDARALFPKSMASASLLAYLSVSKFCDGLPLYRISKRLNRLGIELSHGLMSGWLVEAGCLLDPLIARLAEAVKATGHVFTDDTILPLQNDVPERNSTLQSRLWVYASGLRNSQPLEVYQFSRTRSRDAPAAFLSDYQGYLQADAYPGYDALYASGDIKEVACLAHARRKFVEVAALLKEPGRPHAALAFIRKLYRIERRIRTLSDAERYRVRQAESVPILAEFKAWLDEQINAVLPKSALGQAVSYALKNWDALTRYTEHGQLEADNNYAERCMRPVAVGRKAYLFVGSERAGRAAANYYSLIESCKLNRVNPLNYMNYVFSHLCDKRLTLKLPTEYETSNIAEIG